MKENVRIPTENVDSEGTSPEQSTIINIQSSLGASAASPLRNNSAQVRFENKRKSEAEESFEREEATAPSCLILTSPKQQRRAERKAAA